MAYHKVKNTLDEAGIPFEFIVMDDGSTDNSFALACRLEEEHDNVFAYQLSRNYGSNYSSFAGLTICKGGCAMAIVDDEQQPYETIVEMYRLWEQGHQIIVPYRTSREDDALSSFFSNSYYRLMNSLSEVKFPVGGCDLFLADREVLDILIQQIHPKNTSVMVEVLRLGFSPYYYPYKRPIGLNKGKSRWTFKKKLQLATNSFLSASTFPIKMITHIGLFFSVISLVATLFYIYIGVTGRVLIPGWTSIIVVLFFLGGVILMALGILAEYIWRIYDEVKGRPDFIIKKRKEVQE